MILDDMHHTGILVRFASRLFQVWKRLEISVSDGLLPQHYLAGESIYVFPERKCVFLSAVQDGVQLIKKSE